MANSTIESFNKKSLLATITKNDSSARTYDASSYNRLHILLKCLASNGAWFQLDREISVSMLPTSAFEKFEIQGAEYWVVFYVNGCGSVGSNLGSVVVDWTMEIYGIG